MGKADAAIKNVMNISVIICTHNPRHDFLKRTLEALKLQTFPKDQWEILLINNASEESIANLYDLSWHPYSRHIYEKELGLTHARIRGIRESKGSILAFVDDDNILENQYLEIAQRNLTQMPWLGAIGGQILPEYEILPPKWLLDYERVLAIRRIDKSRWSNSVEDWQSQPWGAGMVIRRNVCNSYLEKVSSNEIFKELDRKGKSLMSGGDTDLVLTSLDIGLGFGVFPEMIVTHLIPQKRMTSEYICRITRSLIKSNLILSYIRGENVIIPRQNSLYGQIRGFYHYLKRSDIQKKIQEASNDGINDFMKYKAKFRE
jgi:glycosyltransferase involved in cell wall biosynthesis